MFSGENLGVSVLHQTSDLLEDDLAALLTSRDVSGVPVRTCGASGVVTGVLLCVQCLSLRRQVLPGGLHPWTRLNGSVTRTELADLVAIVMAPIDVGLVLVCRPVVRKALTSSGLVEALTLLCPIAVTLPAMRATMARVRLVTGFSCCVVPISTGGKS